MEYAEDSCSYTSICAVVLMILQCLFSSWLIKMICLWLTILVLRWPYHNGGLVPVLFNDSATENLSLTISNVSRNKIKGRTTYLFKCLAYREDQHLFLFWHFGTHNLQNCKDGTVAGGACGQCDIFSNQDKEMQVRKMQLYEDSHKKVHIECVRTCEKSRL